MVKKSYLMLFNNNEVHLSYSGTPIQVQRTGKVAGSKSLGDSIKRHIFNKGLLNKTPKKIGSATNMNSIEVIFFL